MAYENLLDDNAGDGRESAAEKLARYMGRTDASTVQAETQWAGPQAGRGLSVRNATVTRHPTPVSSFRVFFMVNPSRPVAGGPAGE